MFDDVGWPDELRPYQSTVLERLAHTWDTGQRRAWVVLPPGTGKTVVGLEAAVRLGRRTVVFAPNTAIQSQWLEHWRGFGGTGTTSRQLRSRVSVLTYQSLAVFDPDTETDEEGHEDGLISRLHPNGQELIAALRDAGPLTLVLDECHHLLDVWGRLLAEVLDELPDAVTIGLTATPPDSLTADEAELVDTLFGAPIVGASVPAMVRQGYLAPFAELSWLATPTPMESEYIATEATRFTELTTDLLAPSFASTGFLEWVDTRLGELTSNTGNTRVVSWEWLERNEPDIAAAALRLHYAGLLGLPPGARMREEHRHAPTAEDWVALLNDYVKNCLLASDDDRDARAVAAIRRALPAVGYQLTRNGIRSARSPVDRVLARSAAKTHGAVEIAAAEADTLGSRLRCLVLCDHERATATLPSGLRAVLDPQAGAATLLLDTLVSDERTRRLCPMLVTGSTVATDEPTARDFVAFVAERSGDEGPQLEVRPTGTGVATITGRWRSRDWVPHVTAFFEAGRCRVLVGTRGLLGEGWNARGINTLIDMTTATTPTSVVQTRGRALRLDPAWPGKAATTWTVVCVSDQHPKGAADWHRFVRKHTGYLVATPDGEIVSGVAHVHAAFSPYAPPETAVFDATNAQMLDRARGRDAIRAAWRQGSAYRDELVHTIRVRTDREPIFHHEPGLDAPRHPAAVPAPDLAAPLPPPSEADPAPQLPAPDRPRGAAPARSSQRRGKVRRRMVLPSPSPSPKRRRKRSDVTWALWYLAAITLLTMLVVAYTAGGWAGALVTSALIGTAVFLVPYLRKRRRQRHRERAEALIDEYERWLETRSSRIHEHRADALDGFEDWLLQPLSVPLGRRRFARHRTRVHAVMAGYDSWLSAHEARYREHCAEVLDSVAGEPPIHRLGYAVADALAGCDMSGMDAAAVAVHVENDGSYRLSLSGVDTATSERFTLALDELLSPVTTPRYVVPRYVVHPAVGDDRQERAHAWREGWARANEVVYHAVPAVFGQNRDRVRTFEKAWHTWVSHGAALYTSAPQGAGIVASHRGEDPFAATTALRIAWD